MKLRNEFEVDFKDSYQSPGYKIVDSAFRQAKYMLPDIITPKQSVIDELNRPQLDAV